MEDAQIEVLNKASKELTGLTFLSLLHKKDGRILDVVHQALTDVQVLCLEKAALNAKAYVSNSVETMGGMTHIEVEVDKDSITSQENLI